MTTRKCKICLKIKPLEDFPKDCGTKNDYRRHQCSPCYAKKTYTRYMKQKEWLYELKATYSCARCGNADFRVLEFHHADPSIKETEVSNALYWSKDKINAEIAKCEVLCVNCHRSHHARERENTLLPSKVDADTSMIYAEGLARTKICNVCKKNKSVDAFQSAGILNGIEYKRRECTYCKKIKQLSRKNSIKAWFEAYKMTLACEVCAVGDGELFEFHHKESTTKEVTLSDAIQRGWSIARIKEEVTKCIVLCGNCHRIHHHEERVAAKKKSSKTPCIIDEPRI